MWTFDIKVGFCNRANKTHFHKVFCSWSRFESEALYNSFFCHVTTLCRVTCIVYIFVIKEITRAINYFHNAMVDWLQPGF